MKSELVTFCHSRQWQSVWGRCPGTVGLSTCDSNRHTLISSCHLSRRLCPAFSAENPTLSADKQLINLNLKETSNPWLAEAIETSSGQTVSNSGLLQVTLAHQHWAKPILA
jgi:hypothetical protein